MPESCRSITQINSYQAIIVSDIDRAYAVFTYKCGQIEWSSVGENNLAVVGFNANGPFIEESEISFKNYRLSGLRGVGDEITCEFEPITNLFIRLPSTQAQRDRLECIAALDRDTELLQGETSQTLADMLKPCPCTEAQCIKDDGSFIKQENSTQNCYITAYPVKFQPSQTGESFTLTQQCCYSRNG